MDHLLLSTRYYQSCVWPLHVNHYKHCKWTIFYYLPDTTNQVFDLFMSITTSIVNGPSFIIYQILPSCVWPLHVNHYKHCKWTIFYYLPDTTNHVFDLLMSITTNIVNGPSFIIYQILPSCVWPLHVNHYKRCKWTIFYYLPDTTNHVFGLFMSITTSIVNGPSFIIYQILPSRVWPLHVNHYKHCKWTIFYYLPDTTIMCLTS